MEERIYTIPINESFDAHEGCPLCRLQRDLEAKSLDYVLGGAMMEPDIRVQTNEQGFCTNHLEKMAKMKNRLSVALILNTHVDEIIKNLEEAGGSSLKKPNAKKFTAYLERLGSSCFVCKRVAGYMKAVVKNILFLYKTEEEFRKKFSSQTYFCLSHSEALLKQAAASLNKKALSRFTGDILSVQLNKLKELSGDINWFCKKFDYRFDKEDWKNSKDSIERTQDILK